MSAHIVLGVRQDASEDEIRKRFRELARTCHPDHGGDPREFIRLKNAYEAMLVIAQNGGSVYDTPPTATQTAADEEVRTRPSWMDEVPDEPRWRGAPPSESRKNLHGNKVVRDNRITFLAFGTLGASIGITIAACIKGAPADLPAIFGQIVLYAIICLVCSGVAAAVGAGSDDTSFVKTYSWVLVAITLALIVVVPLPFHREQAPPDDPFKPKEFFQKLKR